MGCQHHILYTIIFSGIVIFFKDIQLTYSHAQKCRCGSSAIAVQTLFAGTSKAGHKQTRLHHVIPRCHIWRGKALHSQENTISSLTENNLKNRAWSYPLYLFYEHLLRATFLILVPVKEKIDFESFL